MKQWNALSNEIEMSNLQVLFDNDKITEMDLIEDQHIC